MDIAQTLWLAVIISFVYNKRLVQLLVCDFACVRSSGDSSSGFPFGQLLCNGKNLSFLQL